MYIETGAHFPPHSSASSDDEPSSMQSAYSHESSADRDDGGGDESENSTYISEMTSIFLFMASVLISRLCTLRRC